MAWSVVSAVLVTSLAVSFREDIVSHVRKIVNIMSTLPSSILQLPFLYSYVLLSMFNGARTSTSTTLSGAGRNRRDAEVEQENLTSIAVKANNGDDATTRAVFSLATLSLPSPCA